MSEIPDLGAIRAAREAVGLTPEPATATGLPLGALFGKSFAPQPFSYSIDVGIAPDGETPVVYLWFEYAHGRACFVMSKGEAEQVGREMVAKSRLTP